MNEELERRIRHAVRNVDAAPLGAADEIVRGATRRARAADRRRRVALGGATAAVVCLAVVGVVAIAGRDSRDPTTGTLSPAAPPVTTAAPTLTPTSAPTPMTSPAEPSRWRPIAAHPDGIGWDLSAVWMGDEAFVLGPSAYSYDPAQDEWRQLAPFPASWTDLDECDGAAAPCVGEGIGQHPNGYGLVDPIVVWTGEQVVVMGGDAPEPDDAPDSGDAADSDDAPDSGDAAGSGDAGGSGGEQSLDCAGAGCRPNLVKSFSVGYVPADDTWQLLASPPWFVTARSPHAWSGSELFVWPWDVDDTADPAYAYDPAANTWRQLPDVPIPPRQNAASVWTGSEWIVWSGGDDSNTYGRELADGAAYDPATNSWRVLAEAPISPRKAQGVWSGTEMIVMAGSNGGGTSVCCGVGALSDGAAYDPATDTWRPLAGTVGHPGFEALWADDVLLLFAKGGVIVYDVTAQEYVDVCCDGMAGSAHVWTGAEAISFGTYTAGRGGGIFTPP